MSVKMLLAVLVGVLLLWVAATGRLGSLLGALVTPTYMVQGTPPTPGTDNGNGTNSQIGAVQNLPKGGTLTDVQIAGYAFNAGLTGNALITAVAIALAESGGNTAAVSSTGDYGVWQINHAAHPAYSTTQLLTPAYNASAMYAISRQGTNWNAWTTYKNGAYQKYMVQATTAAGNFGKGAVMVGR